MQGHAVRSPPGQPKSGGESGVLRECSGDAARLDNSYSCGGSGPAPLPVGRSARPAYHGCQAGAWRGYCADVAVSHPIWPIVTATKIVLRPVASSSMSSAGGHLNEGDTMSAAHLISGVAVREGV